MDGLKESEEQAFGPQGPGRPHTGACTAVPSSRRPGSPFACILPTGAAGWAWVEVDADNKVGKFLPKCTPELVGP